LCAIRGGASRQAIQVKMAESSEAPAGPAYFKPVDSSGTAPSAGRIVKDGTSEGKGLSNPDRQLLAAIVKASRDAIWSWDTNGVITSWNHEAERMFGYRAEEIIGQSLMVLIPDERKELVQEAIMRLLNGEAYEQYETVRLRKDGTRVDVELTVSPICSDDGAILGVATVCREIGQRKQVEARLKLAIEAAQLGVWDWNLLTDEIIYSHRAKEIWGFDPEAPVTVDMVRAATHPDDLPRTSEMQRRARDPLLREKKAYEYRIIRPDGTRRWVLTHGDAVFVRIGGTEKAVRYAGTIQDITAQKQAAEALAQSAAKLRLAMEAGKMAVWEYNPATESLTWSPEFNRVLGFPPDSKPSIEELRAGYLPGERKRVRHYAEEAYRAGKQSFEMEFRYRWPDQSVHWLLVRAEFLFRNEKIARLIGIVTDITELKQAQELQSLLINELNHRVKNTLATVQSLAVMTAKSKAPTEFAESFGRRLAALSAAHDLLTGSGWTYTTLDTLIDAELKPYMSGQIAMTPSRVPVRLQPRAALSLALAFHELATNAAKHGALSVGSGRLDVAWECIERDERKWVRLAWREQNGPAPKRRRAKGFGSRLIESVVREDLQGHIDLDYASTGLSAAIELPMENVSA
jgi:PAS domain S-box-containing protein